MDRFSLIGRITLSDISYKRFLQSEGERERERLVSVVRAFDGDAESIDS